ncbi:zinc finger protein 2-like [Folsomia candida]|uniref:zinc finger protein 2-like n=1 Tax=Folsomia candida TaxID=158441 RepID=UPI001605208E|nr:zinc finger protein 2-like [Folsomia candida]
MKPGKKRECSKCSKTYQSKKALRRHLVTHDPDAKVKCEICGIISNTRFTLAAHMKSTHSSRPSCDTCHREFSAVSSLQRHIDTVYSAKERPRLPCTFPGCEKTYLSNDKLSKHAKTEHSENPVRFPRRLCGKEFKTRVDLTQHIPTHTTEKPYTCATCGRSFAQKGAMTSHEKTHVEKSGRDKFHCQVCP